MSVRLAALIVTTCLCAAASGQTPAAPNPTRQQRESLQALVSAVDAAASQPETTGVQWRTHVLRASDGSHYVAFTMTPPAAQSLPAAPAIVYVRLATARAIAPQQAERSVVREWLAGTQQAPPALVAKQGIALGDMPVMGPTGSLDRRPPTTPEMANLALIDLERRRARERDAARERQRRDELEGRREVSTETLPFEDFDFAARATGSSLQRALTAGPGDYFLYVAWSEPTAKAEPRVAKRRVTLPIASATELAVGTVILADGIQIRSAPWSPAEQASHPYAIGLTDILPAADAHFSDTENLSAVFQIINAQPASSGKPNLDVNFQIVRINNGLEQPVATLTPQNYSEANLPADFDSRAGHPLFGTVSAPLKTLGGGSYRLKILASDRTAGTSARADVDFSIAATAASLLREAPPLGQPFRHAPILGPDILPALLEALRPATVSPNLQRAFDLAAAGKFVDLMIEEPVPAPEEGVRAALRGLALLAVGDGSSATHFQRAQLLGAPRATTRFLSGAARALQGRDPDAILAWQEALTAGARQNLVVPYLLDAYVRRSDYQRASELLARNPPSPGTWSRAAAAVMVSSGKETEAIPMIEARLSASPDDSDAQWLLLHALFAQHTRTPNATLRDRFVTQAQRYIDAKGAHAAVAEEWMKSVASSQ